jgi:competence protein ComEC
MIDADPAIRCHVLWPARGISPGSDGNDASLVLRLQYGSTGFLLAGDAGMGVENVLVRHYGTFLRAECLKVAHHASLTSAGDEFLAKVAPRIALVSAGRNNRFRHPAGATLARLRAHGASVRRTDLDGATIVESDGSLTTIGP